VARAVVVCGVLYTSWSERLVGKASARRPAARVLGSALAVKEASNGMR
jgi:chorismate synthase